MERKAAGAKVVLVRRDAETRDIAALDLADGLLTQRGARTSHAAVVARQLGKVCPVGCENLVIDERGGVAHIGGLALREDDGITLDGNEGVLYAGTTQHRYKWHTRHADARLSYMMRLKLGTSDTTRSGSVCSAGFCSRSAAPSATAEAR